MICFQHRNRQNLLTYFVSFLLLIMSKKKLKMKGEGTGSFPVQLFDELLAHSRASPLHFRFYDNFRLHFRL